MARQSNHVRRLGILTSGGDGPGMNACIRAAVRTALRNDVEVVGYIDGFSGLVRREFIPLGVREVGNQIQRGGTFLGTSRCPEFMDADVRAEAVAGMREAEVEGLIVVGGDGSFRGALALQEEHGFAVAGAPGTIDNDVWGTEETIGFDTAVNTAVRAIDQLRDTGESTGMMFFVEVMGRSSGAIALNTALAAGAAGVCVPERQEDLRAMADRILETLAEGKRSHIVVVAEGDHAGGAYEVAKKIAAIVDRPYRVVVLGHIQRGGNPTVRDRMVASLSGANAASALIEGRHGVMIGMQGGRPVEVPLEEVVAHSHPEARHDLLRLAEELSG